MKSMMMKKLVVAATVAAGSLAAQADKLYWSASGIESSSANPLAGTGQYLAYLFCTRADAPSNNGVSTLKNTSYITTLDAIQNLLASSDAKSQDLSTYAKVYGSSSGWLNDGYSNGTASYSKNSIGQIGGTTDQPSVVDFFAVVLDAATWADAKNYMILTGSDGNPISLESANGWNSSAEAIYDFGSQANNTWSAIGTVPEPTSGVLLLVGIAALALRRKRTA